MNKYKNPWYTPHNGMTEYYENDGRVILEYRGVKIIKVWDNRYDYVYKDTCITQRAGCSDKAKAKQIIDKVLDGDCPYTSDTVKAILTV